MDEPKLPYRPDLNSASPDQLHVFLLVIFILNGILSIISFYKYYDSQDQNAALEQAIKQKDQSIAQLVFQVKQESVFHENATNAQVNALIPTCHKILEANDKQYTACHLTDVATTDKDQLLGINLPSFNHVTNFTISRDKKRLIVVTYSEEYLKKGGSPIENAMYLVDIDTGKVTQLFSRIFFPNFKGGNLPNGIQDPESSWSSNNKGIVFTAGAAALPDIINDVDPYAVVYCDEKCRVLAKDAGPYGNGADAAYFSGNDVKYTDKAGNSKTLPFK